MRWLLVFICCFLLQCAACVAKGNSLPVQKTTIVTVSHKRNVAIGFRILLNFNESEKVETTHNTAHTYYPNFIQELPHLIFLSPVWQTDQKVEKPYFNCCNQYLHYLLYLKHSFW